MGAASFGRGPGGRGSSRHPGEGPSARRLAAIKRSPPLMASFGEGLRFSRRFLRKCATRQILPHLTDRPSAVVGEITGRRGGIPSGAQIFSKYPQGGDAHAKSASSSRLRVIGRAPVLLDCAVGRHA